MICIVDYGMGNIFSIKKKLTQIGVESIVTNKPDEIAQSTKIILPGVGHFGKAIEQLQKLNLIDVLNEEVLVNRKPILGVCLGMQLLAKFSEEGDVPGLGWLDANVKRFKMENTVLNKVPHTGWNSIFSSKPSRLLKDVPDGSEFYFVHSYYIEVSDAQDQLTHTIFERPFASAVEKENIFGVQFHPEKSHEIGSQLVRNFIEL